MSRDVFNATNHLRACRGYAKKNRPLPVLSVIDNGILSGYVPVDKDWTGFSAEEYQAASESVKKEQQIIKNISKVDMTGYHLVRDQFFSTLMNPALTMTNGKLWFNTACMKRFRNVEYMELLLNTVERCIAIRPCDKNNPNAIHWGKLADTRWMLKPVVDWRRRCCL